MEDAAHRMREAAEAWLASLDAAQREKATFDFDDADQRSDWAYFPRDHAGLPLLEQDAAQQKLLHVLLTSGLSLPAYAKATAIMALESVLNEIEERRIDAMRDPGRYFLSVFGSPDAQRWGWRLEGHHVCLNFTIVDGEVASATPIFLGANPAQVTRGDAVVLRPCGEEEDAGRELLLSLDREQRSEAVISDTAPPDFVLSNAPAVPDVCLPGEAQTLFPPILGLFKGMPDEEKEALKFERANPKGLAAAGMTSQQQALLSRLIDVYTSRLTDPLADDERARIDVSSLHFAWAGELDRGGAHYYRLQGPAFLVEYDNTQNDANHVHAVWRSPDNDFGGDLLRSHLRRDHQ